MRAIFRRTLFTGMAVMLGVAPALAGPVTVPLDEARMIEFDTPVATIYMGNPTIADVTIVDSRHAFLLGKGFGTTNMIALNSKGEQVSERHIVVTSRESTTVTLNRGGNQLTFACANRRCEPAPIPGDARALHDETMGETTMRQEMASKAAQEPTGTATTTN